MSSPDDAAIQYQQALAEREEREREPMWSERQAAILEDDQPDRRERVGDTGRLAHELCNAVIRAKVLQSDVIRWARLFLAATASDTTNGCPIQHSAYTGCWRCHAREEAAHLLEASRGKQ